MSLAPLQRLLPATLFGRLALLLLGFALLGHVLALTVIFELLQGPPGGPPHGPPPLPRLGLLADIGVRLAVVTLAAWIAASWLSRPILQLARAAHDFGSQVGSATRRERRPTLAESGPRECREAARVFNRMQARIEQQLEERDRFVAAVSHDLRTPLTRLRLRTESLDDDAQQETFRRDIAEMEQMIGATLDHLLGRSGAEAMARLDVQSLVDSIAQDQRDSGHDVQASGHAAALQARPLALRRCIVNLVDNAVRYAGHAHIVLIDGPGMLTVEVRDQGPGIAADELDRVLQPYYRVEASRSKAHGGFGLGLSIAQDIARQHRGALQLSRAEGGGLVVRLLLPR